MIRSFPFERRRAKRTGRDARSRRGTRTRKADGNRGSRFLRKLLDGGAKISIGRVRIPIGYGDAAVAREPHDGGERHRLVTETGYKEVPQLMPRAAAHPVTLLQRLERAEDVRPTRRRSARRQDDPVVGLLVGYDLAQERQERAVLVNGDEPMGVALRRALDVFGQAASNVDQEGVEQNVANPQRAELSQARSVISSRRERASDLLARVRFLESRLAAGTVLWTA